MWAHQQVPTGSHEWTPSAQLKALDVASSPLLKDLGKVFDFHGPYVVSADAAQIRVRSIRDGQVMAQASLPTHAAGQINVIRCRYISPVLEIITASGVNGNTPHFVTFFKFDGTSQRLTCSESCLSIEDSISDILYHPVSPERFIVCQVPEIATYDLGNLTAPCDITDLRPYLRMIKYYRREIAAPKSCKVVAAQVANHCYLAVLAEGFNFVAIVTDNWPVDKFRFEGAVELPGDQCYKDLSLLAGGRSELPSKLYTFVSAARLSPLKLELDPTPEPVSRLFLIANTDTSMITIPLYITPIDLLTAVVRGVIESQITFERVICSGSCSGMALFSVQEDANDSAAYALAYTPSQMRVSGVPIPGPTLSVREEAAGSHIRLLGNNWTMSLPSPNIAVALSADEEDASFGALAADRGSVVERPAGFEDSGDAVEPSVSAAAPSVPHISTEELRSIRSTFIGEIEKLKIEMSISAEAQLAQAEASIVQRLQAHTKVYLQNDLREAIADSEGRIMTKLEELSEKMEMLATSDPRSSSPPARPAAPPAARQVHKVECDCYWQCGAQDQGLRALRLNETESREFAEGFSIECVARGYAEAVPRNRPDYELIQTYTICLRNALQQQQYDKAIFNAANLDLSTGTRGFWTVLTAREFEAKDLIRAQSKTIAMAAVRMLSESLDNWYYLPYTPENLHRCVRAVWKNELVRVPLLEVTKLYLSIEPRLRWIQ